VTGAIGDTFTLIARDSFAVPATTPTVPVSGAIVAVNALTDIVVQPSTLTGGTNGVGTVTMRYPVRRASEGLITLTSSSPAATVPATVAIPVGGSFATFGVTTTAVLADTAATLTASAPFGPSQSTTVTVLSGALALTQFVLDESSVDAGSTIQATLVLNSPAPDGGARVSISSSQSGLAPVPAVIVIPEGATSFGFTIETYPVAANTGVTFTATYSNTVSATASLVACEQLTALVPPPASTTLGTTWLDDSLPSGALQSGDGVIDSTQFASGSSAIHLGAGTGIHTFAFTGAAPLTVTPGDNLVVHALVNPCRPPRQILIGWKAGANEYRASWGESRIEATTAAHRIINAVPRGGEWVRLEVPARLLGITSTVAVTDFSIRTVDGEAWLDAIGTTACTVATAPAPQLNPSEIVWFDDALPTGAFEPDSASVFQWDSTQAASGTRSHRESLQSGQHAHSFLGATQKLQVDTGDVLFTYVYLDPCNPPKQILLSFFDGTSWDHRAYWGDSLMSVGTEGTASRSRIGPLPETGRWIRLEVPASSVGMENRSAEGAAYVLFDGQAWFDRVGRIPRVNVAAGKTATQSTTLQNLADYAASKAVDSNFSTFNHTESQAQPWWQVDLGVSYPIEHIRIYNRIDAGASRLANFWVLVSDEPFASSDLSTVRAQPGVTAMRHAEYPASGEAVFQVNRTGRFVRVQLEGSEYLHMRDVEVWTQASPSRSNLAIGRRADQSTDLHPGYVAAHGVDGILNYRMPHTLHQAMPWWQVNLGSIQPVSTISLFNREACDCSNRLSNFWVFVSDDAFTSDDASVTASQSNVRAYFYPSIPLVAEVPIHGKGQYVRIQLNGTDYLHVSEVQIWSQHLVLGPMSRVLAPSPPQR